MEQIPHNMKHIILANMNVKVGEVIVLIPPSSSDHF